MRIEQYEMVQWVLTYQNQPAFKPWKFQFFLIEIKELASSLSVAFYNVIRSANVRTDSLAKQGVQRLSPLEVVPV